jgi:hypothetical protein
VRCKVSITIEGRTLQRVSIVDDDRSVRQSYEMSVQELNLQAVNESGPLGDLQQFLDAGSQRADAAVCDFKLRVKKYANFDGAALVASWYDRGFPALLCTKYDRASADEIRTFRPRIPVLLTPDELGPEIIVNSLATCIRELRGMAPPSRQLWTTVVRVEDVDRERLPSAYLIVPAWNPNETVRLLLSDVPTELHPLFTPEARLLADVNLGAEAYADLFFLNWKAA